MSKNTGIPYEHLTRHIFDQILNQHSVNTIDVRHDVLVKGLRATHQIDVYWEFEVGGIKYATIVQAKDWAYPVNQGELIKFKGVLDDIPGQPRGIVVTKTGYQSGASEYASACGILLYELREASEDDLKDRVKTLVISLVSYVPHASGFNLLVDDDWFKNERIRLNIAPSDVFTIQISGMPDEIIFVDQHGTRQSDAQEIIRSFYPSHYQETAPIVKTHTFAEDTFVLTNDGRFPRVKVRGAQATISVSKAEEEIHIGGENIVYFILKNVVEDSARLFDDDMNLIK